MSDGFRTKSIGVGLPWGRAVVSLLFATSVARAQAPSIGATRLSFVRAESATDCAAAPVIEREIARRMGRDPFVGVPQQWIEGYIAKPGEYFEVQLFERDANGATLGTRRLRESATDCHKLDDAIVLAIALIIDPNAQLAPPLPRESALAPPIATTIAPPTASASPAPVGVPTLPPPGPASNHRAELAPAGRDRDVPTKSKNSRGESAAFVAADAVLVYGALPGVAPGVELSTKLTLTESGPLAMRLSALFLPEKRSSDEVGDFGYGLTAMQVGLCAGRAESRIVLLGCADMSVGAVHAVVHTPAPFEPGDRLWTALRLDGGVALRVAGPLWFDARLFGLLVPRRWEFLVREQGKPGQRAFLQSYVMPGMALGIGLAF